MGAKLDDQDVSTWTQLDVDLDATLPCETDDCPAGATWRFTVRCHCNGPTIQIDGPAGIRKASTAIYCERHKILVANMMTNMPRGAIWACVSCHCPLERGAVTWTKL